MLGGGPVNALTTDILVQIAYAVGIGLLVGLEREHADISEESEDDGTEAKVAAHTVILGARTFALISLLGWVSALASEQWGWIAPVAFAAVAALVGIQYFAVRTEGMGMTTEVAALVVFASGMLVRDNRPVAVGLALVTTLLLVSKPLVRNFVARMRRVEITATLQLLVLLAIVLPMLPAEPQDPWGVLPPQKIGLFVILIGGIGYVGYVLTRLFGKRRSAGLTGVLGGLTSSTAVTAAMAQQARNDPGMQVPGQLATFLANAMMFVRVLVVTAVLSRKVALALAPPLVVMGLVMLAGAVWKWRVTEDAPTGEGDRGPRLQNPFALVPALKWGVVLCAVLLLAHFAQATLGDSGFLVAAAASGLADVDAITLAATSQAAGGTLSVDIASLAIAIAVISNTIVKGGIAWFAGGRPFGRDVLKIFAGSMAAGAAIAVRVLLF